MCRNCCDDDCCGGCGCCYGNWAMGWGACLVVSCIGLPCGIALLFKGWKDAAKDLSKDFDSDNF